MTLLARTARAARAAQRWQTPELSRPSPHRGAALAVRAQSGDAAAVRAALRGRRTVNDFEPELPEDWEASLRRAVEAAALAPNHRRTEPWRFYLLSRERALAVSELNAALVEAKKGPEAAATKLERWSAVPGWLVVTQTPAPKRDAPGDLAGREREDYAACCCAVQNLCLALHSEGIGTKWTTGPVNFHEGFAAAAGLPSSDEYVVGTVWFGKAAKLPPPPPKRLSVDDILIKCE